MADQSHLDSKYFVDPYVYNCPFCNRRNVSYAIVDIFRFDWSKSKQCFVYVAQCSSCENRSMHLSFTDIPVKDTIIRHSPIPKRIYHFELEEGQDLDDLFFYSVPTSFFVMDDRIHSLLRQSLSEAEGCLKSNFLTGASACARKVVYELAKREGAEGDSYEERLKSLKKIRTDVDPTYFDTLLTIHETTSDKVHESAYDGWESKHLRLLLGTLTEILNEMYVEPKVREERRKAILNLKEEVLGKGKTTAESELDKGQSSP